MQGELAFIDNAVDTVAAAQPGCTLTSSNFGFRIRSQTPLRFLRSGGGAETLDVTVAPEPRSRPATPPLVEWTFRGPDREVRCTLYQIQRAFELWASDMGAYHIDPTVGRIEMPESDDALMREQRMWGVPAALCCMHRGDLPLHAAAVEIESRAVVIAAPGRHGKTTLALAFQRHGYRVLTEDLACCSVASASRLRILSVLPSRSPTTVLIWASASLIVSFRLSVENLVTSGAGSRSGRALGSRRRGGSAPRCRRARRGYNGR